MALLLAGCLSASFTPASLQCGVVCGQRAATVAMGMGEMAMETERKPPVELLALSMKGMTKKELESIYSVSDMLFNVVDRNGNEIVSKEELAAHLLLARYTEDSIEALFDLIDVNGDGKLTRDELRDAFVRHPSLRSAPAMGTLSKQKRSAVFEEADETFTAIDINQNGTLSIDELKAYFAGREGPSYSEAAVAQIFVTLTTNGSIHEEITRSEFRGSFVRYRAMRLALGLTSAVPDA